MVWIGRNFTLSRIIRPQPFYVFVCTFDGPGINLND